MQKALVDMGAAKTAQRVLARLPDDPQGRERAVVLLEAAATALLKAGARRRDLEELAGEELLDRAVRRLVAPPQFRSIFRGGSR